MVNFYEVFCDLWSRVDKGNLTSRVLKELYDAEGEYAIQAADPEWGYCSEPASRDVVLRMVADYGAGLREVLDVGIGGNPVVGLALAKAGVRITGIEFSRGYCRLAKRACERAGAHIRIVEADAQSLPFPDDAFDGVICSETLEHVLDDRQAAAEIHRVLRPAGMLFLTVPCKTNLVKLHRRLAAWWRREYLPDHPSHLREYSASGARQLVRGKFQILRRYMVPFTHRPFREMPLEVALGLLIRLPVLRNHGHIAYVACSLKSGGEALGATSRGRRDVRVMGGPRESG